MYSESGVPHIILRDALNIHWAEKSSLLEFVFKGKNDKKTQRIQRISQGLDGKCHIGGVWSLALVQCEVTVGFCSA